MTFPLLHFNVNAKSDWTPCFEKHISTTLKQASNWPSCKPLIQKLVAERNEFDFKRMNETHKVDSSCIILMTKMEEYLRNLNYLSSRFKFGKIKGSVADFQSRWWCCITKENYESSHIRFETLNITYNYAILNFNMAMHDAAGHDKDVNKLKEALKKLRAAKWAMGETLKFTSMMAGVMKLPFEFSQENLMFLQYMFEALAYQMMMKIFDLNPNFQNDQGPVVSLCREVYVWFSKCKQVLDNSKDVKNYHSALGRLVVYNYYDWGFKTLGKTATFLMVKHEGAITKGHIGTAISYLGQLRGFVESVLKDKTLEKQQKKEFEARWDKEWGPMLKKLEEKNKEVYKAVVPKPGEVKAIEEWENAITDSAPVNIYVPPEGFEHFQNFLSEELEKIESNLQLYLQNKKQFLQKLSFDIQQKKEQIYREKNIPFILTSKSLSGAKLDDSFFQNMKLIGQTNGGLQGYEGLKNKVQNERNDVGSILAHIDQKVTAVKNDDAKFIAELKQSGIDALVDWVNFDVANQDLISNIIGKYFYFLIGKKLSIPATGIINRWKVQSGLSTSDTASG
jgi:hypothetical protein